MKKIILTSVITIAAVVAFAQVAGTNQTLSPKELVKLQVVKIDPAKANTYRLTTAIALNLSLKEAIKVQVARNTSGVIQIENSNISDCPSCLALSAMSQKEQMKAQVVGLYKCPVDYNTFNNNVAKCRFCGMQFTAKN